MAEHAEARTNQQNESWKIQRKRNRRRKPAKYCSALEVMRGESDVSVAVRTKKAKFNTALIDATRVEEPKANGTGKPTRRKEKSPSPSIPQKRKASPSIPQKRKASPMSSPSHHRTPSFHEPTTQLPLRNEESPSNSPISIVESPPRGASTSKSKSTLESEIAALKQSMRRPTTTATNNTSHKRSALESLIPSTSTRGRKRPRPGDSLKDDRSALNMLNAFRTRLESAETTTDAVNGTEKGKGKEDQPHNEASPTPDDEEAQLCDLHFIANCQSCSGWPDESNQKDDDGGRGFLQHSLTFARDRLGKDLEWKKNMRNLKEEDMGDVGIIDVKGKEREVKERESEKKRRERERRR